MLDLIQVLEAFLSQNLSLSFYSTPTDPVHHVRGRFCNPNNANMGNRASIQGDDVAPTITDPRDIEETKKPLGEVQDEDDMVAAGDSDSNEASLIDYKTLTWWYVADLNPRFPRI